MSSDKDHPARAQIRMIRHLLPAAKSPGLLGPIIDNRCGSPIWRIGDLQILATVQPDADGTPWYHVSYSLIDKTPTHEQTCMVRTAMFRPDVVVVAVFPPVDEYVNLHPFCLHLWQRLTKDRLIPDLRVDGVPGLTGDLTI
jgi:hypothetical protein